MCTIDIEFKDLSQFFKCYAEDEIVKCVSITIKSGSYNSADFSDPVCKFLSYKIM